MRILMRRIQFGKVSNDLASLIQVPVRIAPSGFQKLLDIDRSSQTGHPFIIGYLKEELVH
jgi:hypothetical protein